MQPTENAAVQVRLSGPEFDSLENWRRAQGKIPPRSDAIRELLKRALEAEQRRRTRPMDAPNPA
jgi:Arc/MetJ-type ribon-helix-helix transcriptional regulator